MFDVGWREENLQFFRRTLSVKYIEQRLQTAQGMIESAAAKLMASRIVGDLHAQAPLLSLRIEQLPAVLTNVSDVHGFTI